MVPVEIIPFRSEVLGSFVSVDIFNPISSLLDGSSRIVTQQSRDACSITLETKKEIYTQKLGESIET